MARPKNKEDFVVAAMENFSKLWLCIESIPEVTLDTEFDFSSDLKKKEAHWSRDKNLRDVLIHLYEWHQLLLNWISKNMSGNKSNFLPKPYTWKTYGEMNIEFWKNHQETQLEDAMKMVKMSHQKSLKLVQKFSNDALFTKQYFDWTGTTSLGSYCVSALPSHYDWATKKLRAHTKMCLRGKSER
jgi:hypothetical protein